MGLHVCCVLIHDAYECCVVSVTIVSFGTLLLVVGFLL